MRIFSDIGDFFSSLSFIDIVFFFLVMILIILVVTLIYFIRINEDEKKDKLEETAEMKIVKELKESMDKENSVVINLSDYEKDQEDKAIISYDELLNKSNRYGLNYEKEELHDDVTVKKVDLDNISSNTIDSSKSETRVISFAKEEAFLEALKRLQKELG